jgi:D-alanyl-D-alanine carboxypeptidase (penicillin-binding protein 5/6)
MFEPTRRRVEIAPLVVGGLFLLLIAFVVIQTVRPLPAITATTTVAPETVLGNAVKPQMPTSGGSTVAVTGLGVIGAGGSDGSRPIASVTKMMTAYIILKNKPLQPNETGPTITITAADQSRYATMIAQDQSSLPVAAGQKFTELEMLEGMLIPSANNFAEILAAWEAGSLSAFVDKMNSAARELGMTNTIYSDVSGFSAGSTSSPGDQLILARAVMANPVFSQIVSMEQVRLPNLGVVESTNEALGKDGVVGIKTGFTEDAGGNLAFAARRQAAGQDIEIIGMVFGMSDKPAAFTATHNIVTSVAQNIQVVQVMKKDQPVATIATPWGGAVDVIATEDVSMLLWPGMMLQAQVTLDPVSAPSKAGSQAGTLSLRLGDQTTEMPVVLAKSIEKPGLMWRLTHF